MFRRIVPLGVLLVSISASAQVGIGTNRPDKSAMLDIESVDSNHYNGVLIPRIPLKNLHDGSLINNGKIANSLLVFNTTVNNELTAGYYYWFDSMWVRLVTDNDNFDSKLVRNEELAVDPAKEVLYLKDTKGKIVDVPIRELNLITFITNDGNGKITYTNEEGNEYDINVPNEVIQNIQNIINNQDVQDTIMNVVNASGQELTVNGPIFIANPEKAKAALLEPLELGIQKKGITTEFLGDAAVTTDQVANAAVTSEKLNGGNTGVDYRFAISDGSGKVTYSEFPLAEVIPDGKIVNLEGIIHVDHGEHSTFSDVELGINDHAIPVAKFDAENAPVGSVATVVARGKLGNQVVYAPLSSESLQGGKTISTDGIIGITNENGQAVSLSDAVLKDFTLQVNDSSIGVGKLNSDGEKEGNVLISDGKGGFTYSSGEALGNTGKDLKLGSSLVFTACSNGKGAVLVPTNFEVASNGIATSHVQRGAITTDKISSSGKGANNILVSDGQGTTLFKAVSEVVVNPTANLTMQNGLMFYNGTTGINAVNTPTTMGIAAGGVQTVHLANRAVTPSKISSENSLGGTVLVADGSGNASFKSLSEVGSSTPNFFYLPSIELQVAAGARFTENLYNDYVKQFGSPQVVSSGSSSRSLQVLQPNQLNFFVTYYDTNVFQSVQIDQNGVMTYVVKSGGNLNLTSSSFMNIVVQVK